GVAFTVFRAETHEGLPSNDIRALAEDRSGKLWIGTFNGGVSRYLNGRVKRYTTTNGLPSNSILGILVDRAARIWFGSGNGVAQFKDEAFLNFGSSDGLVGLDVWSIREDSKGRLWIATGSALHRLSEGRLHALTPGVGLPDGPIRDVFVDRQDVPWLATTG